MSCERVSVVKFSFDDTEATPQAIASTHTALVYVRAWLQHMQNADQVNTDTRRVEVRMTPLEELQRKWPR